MITKLHCILTPAYPENLGMHPPLYDCTSFVILPDAPSISSPASNWRYQRATIAQSDLCGFTKLAAAQVWFRMRVWVLVCGLA